MKNQDVNKDVLDIMSDMLIESQIHNENDDVTPKNNYVSDDEHVHEDVEVDTVVTHVGVANNHVETLRKDVIGKDESLLLICAINSRVYRLFTKGTQSIDDTTPHNYEYFDPIGLDMERVITDKPGNTMLSAEEDGSFCDDVRP